MMIDNIRKCSEEKQREITEELLMHGRTYRTLLFVQVPKSQYRTLVLVQSRTTGLRKPDGSRCYY